MSTRALATLIAALALVSACKQAPPAPAVSQRAARAVTFVGVVVDAGVTTSGGRPFESGMVEGSRWLRVAPEDPAALEVTGGVLVGLPEQADAAVWLGRRVTVTGTWQAAATPSGEAWMRATLMEDRP